MEILSVEMESLQFVGCSWFIGLIGLVSDSPRIKSSQPNYALLRPSPVSSSTRLDAPGVAIATVSFFSIGEESATL